jgi:hypothetical protein
MHPDTRATPTNESRRTPIDRTSVDFFLRRMRRIQAQRASGQVCHDADATLLDRAAYSTYWDLRRLGVRYVPEYPFYEEV